MPGIAIALSHRDLVQVRQKRVVDGHLLSLAFVLRAAAGLVRAPARATMLVLRGSAALRRTLTALSLLTRPRRRCLLLRLRAKTRGLLARARTRLLLASPLLFGALRLLMFCRALRGLLALLGLARLLIRAAARLALGGRAARGLLVLLLLLRILLGGMVAFRRDFSRPATARAMRLFGGALA